MQWGSSVFSYPLILNDCQQLPVCHEVTSAQNDHNLMFLPIQPSMSGNAKVHFRFVWDNLGSVCADPCGNPLDEPWEQSEWRGLIFLSCCLVWSDFSQAPPNSLESEISINSLLPCGPLKYSAHGKLNSGCDGSCGLFRWSSSGLQLCIRPYSRCELGCFFIARQSLSTMFHLTGRAAKQSGTLHSCDVLRLTARSVSINICQNTIYTEALTLYISEWQNMNAQN